MYVRSIPTTGDHSSSAAATQEQQHTLVAARTADDASASALEGLVCSDDLCAICAKFQLELSTDALLCPSEEPTEAMLMERLMSRP